LEYTIELSEIRKYIPVLRAGDIVKLNGIMYTSRDAAHKRIFELLDRGEKPPYPIEDATIYYAGPTPARDGQAVGACGPTTSSRMDRFAPRLISMGLACMVGKGIRNQDVADAMQKYGAVYLAAIGGAGALISSCIQSAEVIAFEDLGCESVKRFRVENFPAVVAMDAFGGNMYR